MQPLTKRQREILDYLNEFIQQHGYAPSLEEIGRRFSLSSLATVHKHLTNLQDKGFIRRAWNRSRSVELRAHPHRRPRGRNCRCSATSRRACPSRRWPPAESISVPEMLVGKRDTYVLRVRGRFDDRRADSRRRLRHRRGSQVGGQRRNGDRAGRGAATSR